MRAAVFSDVHGNRAALEAVLDAAEHAQVDEYWVVGDLVAHGPHPGATVRRLSELTRATVVRGNTDRYVVTGDVSPYLMALDPAQTPDKDSMVADSRAGHAWTRAAVEDAGCLDWLAALPMETRRTLPDGTHVLLVHASPGTDDGPGLCAEQTDQEIRETGVTRTGAQLLFCGHTHVAMDRRVDGVRVVNVSSVSLPATGDSRARWTLLLANDAGYTLEHRAVGYDLEATIAALRTEGHPCSAWLEAKMRRHT